MLLGIKDLQADEDLGVKQQLRLLQQQNDALQEQLRRQQTLIESLTRKVDQIESTTTRSGRELQDLVSEVKEAPKSKTFSFGNVSLSGEGGIALFETGSRGAFPNAEFRIDEAKLFVEAPIWKDVYFYTELNLATREQGDVSLHVGELYLDFENVSRVWKQERVLGLRIGRMDIPFGEEYLTRDAIDNPLISHSLVDLWGVDEGLELYGWLGKVSYVAAVQNGGLSDVNDFDADKSVTARVGFDPTRWLHASLSGMRTGQLDSNGDPWSALWFGNGFIRPLGAATKFHAELVEGDLSFRLPRGHVSLSGGYVHYDDNEPGVDNQRDVYHYSVEAVHELTHKLYAAVRFSQVFAHDGFPILGNGQFGEYFFGYPTPAKLTEEIWRLSLGLGYRWGENLLTKAEYTFERGKVLGGERREHEDLFALEAAFKF